MLGVLDDPMSRKRSEPEPEPKVVVVGIKATSDWREWLQRGAKHCRTDAAKLIDAAVAEYLSKRGFTEKPPERA